MKIRTIILKTGTLLTSYTPTYLPYQKWQTTRSIGTRSFLCLTTTDTSLIPIIVDLDKLLRDMTNKGFSVWSSLELMISAMDLTPYTVTNVPCPNYTLDVVTTTLNSSTYKLIESPVHSKAIVPLVINCDNNHKLDISYGTFGQPYVEQIPALQWKVTDLIFRHKLESGKSINLANALPIVNGSAVYPIMDGSRVLYARNARDLVRPIRDNNFNIMLVDFTSFGGMECVQFSECTDLSSQDVVAFDLPLSMSMTNKTVIASINGKLFFDDAVMKLSEKRVQLKLDVLAQANPRVHSDFNKRNTDPSTSHLPVENLTSLFVSKLKDDRSNSFLILINNPNVCTVRTPAIHSLAEDMFLFPTYVGGFLIDKTSKAVKDYVLQRYESSTLLGTTHNPVKTLNSHTSDNHIRTIGFVNHQSWFNTPEDLDKCAYELLEIYAP